MADLTNYDVLERDRRPLRFLSLTPATSDYATPASPVQSPPSAKSVPSPSTEASRRDSITSTDSKDAPKRLRFLKLGPVQNGSHLDEHKDAYHELDVELE